MTQANTSDFGRRVGPVEYGTPPPPNEIPTTPPPPANPTDLSAPAAPQAEPVAAEVPPQPTFWTYDQAQAAGDMEPTFKAKVQALIKAAGGRLWLTSGFRDNELQKRLFAEALKKHGEADAPNWVAYPRDPAKGHNGSNHERGEAADIFGDQALLHQLAPQFGLTFPMSWESWHVEPVGLRKESAAEAYTKGPTGTTNPTMDQSLDSSPQEIVASLSHVMTQGVFGQPGQPKTTNDPIASIQAASTGGLVGALGTQTGNYSVPVVTGTRNSMSPGGPVTTTSATTGAGGATNMSAAAPQQASASQQDFINTIRPFAEAESKRTGIPVEVMMVQSGVETGWGSSGWWTSNRNPAGIGVTGAPGAGNSYPDLATAFHDYADKLLGHGEAGQEKFAADVAAGASVEQLLADIQQSPWAAGHYGGNGLVQTYQALAGGGAFTPASAPSPAPKAAPKRQSAPAMAPVTQRRNY